MDDYFSISTSIEDGFAASETIQCFATKSTSLDAYLPRLRVNDNLRISSFLVIERFGHDLTFQKEINEIQKC